MKKLKNILLIDDDSISNILTKLHLQRLDITEEVQIVTNGQEGLDYLKKQCSPELILLDINMPVMDGFEFLEQFVDLPLTDKPIIVMYTSSSDPKDIKKAESFHVAGYINKPFTREKLYAILDKLGWFSA
ncbi:MAG: response regulator [Bacteroidota bacterium]